MEERITIKKESILKELVLAGLQAGGYVLLCETSSRYPIKVFHNHRIASVALYDSGPYQDDELVIVNPNKPGKVNILIKEYRSKEFITREKDRFSEVADILEDLLSFHGNEKHSEKHLT